MVNPVRSSPHFLGVTFDSSFMGRNTLLHITPSRGARGHSQRESAEPGPSFSHITLLGFLFYFWQVIIEKVNIFEYILSETCKYLTRIHVLKTVGK